MKDARLQVRLRPQLKEQASKAARRRGVTLSAFIVQCLQSLVEADRVARAVRPNTVDVEQV